MTTISDLMAFPTKRTMTKSETYGLASEFIHEFDPDIFEEMRFRDVYEDSSFMSRFACDVLVETIGKHDGIAVVRLSFDGRSFALARTDRSRMVAEHEGFSFFMTDRATAWRMSSEFRRRYGIGNALPDVDPEDDASGILDFGPTGSFDPSTRGVTFAERTLIAVLESLTKNGSTRTTLWNLSDGRLLMRKDVNGSKKFTRFDVASEARNAFEDAMASIRIAIEDSNGVFSMRNAEREVSVRIGRTLAGELVLSTEGFEDEDRLRILTRNLPLMGDVFATKAMGLLDESMSATLSGRRLLRERTARLEGLRNPIRPSPS